MRAASGSYVANVHFARHLPWSSAAARWLQRLMTSAIDPYRPERHYMRGPGPKWREKMRATDWPSGPRLPLR
jgi:hypothetical protein